MGSIADKIRKRKGQQKEENHPRPELVADPRPDLTEDSELWEQLLRLAYEVDPMLSGTLHGFRCGGTRLKQNSKGDYILRPEKFDPSGLSAWTSQEEYDEFKEKYLAPYAEEIKKLLGKLRCEE